MLDRSPFSGDRARSRGRFVAGVLLSLLLGACRGEAPGLYRDAGTEPDAGSMGGTGRFDAGQPQPDAGTVTVDAGWWPGWPVDAGEPLDAGTTPDAGLNEEVEHAVAPTVRVTGGSGTASSSQYRARVRIGAPGPIGSATSPGGGAASEATGVP